MRLKATYGGSATVVSVPNGATWDAFHAAAAAGLPSLPPLTALSAAAGFPPTDVPIDGSGTLAASGVKSGSVLALRDGGGSVSPAETPAAPAPAPEPAVPQATDAAGAGAEDALPEVWECSACTYRNVWARTVCEMCTGPQPAAVLACKAGAAATAVATPPPRTAGAAMCRVPFPADNNCLFTSVAWLLNGGCSDKGAALRQVVADAVAADPATWTQAVLGRSPAAYRTWITAGDETWGGAIELQLLASHFGTTLVALDIQTQAEHVFRPPAGGDGQLAFLLYDGLHYDPAGLDPAGAGTPSAAFERRFQDGDEVAWAAARALLATAHAAKAFTDVSSFTLRCLVCQAGLTGQADAVKHAQSTGHTNFAEYK